MLHKFYTGCSFWRSWDSNPELLYGRHKHDHQATREAATAAAWLSSCSEDVATGLLLSSDVELGNTDPWLVAHRSKVESRTETMPELLHLHSFTDGRGLGRQLGHQLRQGLIRQLPGSREVWSLLITGGRKSKKIGTSRAPHCFFGGVKANEGPAMVRRSSLKTTFVFCQMQVRIRPQCLCFSSSRLDLNRCMRRP